MECNRRGLDSDASRPFRRKEIRHRRTLVHVSDPARKTAIVEHAFRRGGLAGVDVRDDPDVSGAVEDLCPF